MCKERFYCKNNFVYALDTLKPIHMEFITFKTNINSESAVERIAPLLNIIVGKANWQIDIFSSDKKLTAYSQSILNEIEIINAIHKAGFSATSIDDYYLIY
jgi:hypothetical protein